MGKATTLVKDSSAESWTRRLRLALKLTQQELADRCGVLEQEVDLFEQGLPVRLDVKRKLLKELWATKNALCQTFPR